MKTIKNIELLKKLQPYIKGDTEFVDWDTYPNEKILWKEKTYEQSDQLPLKTLTTDEAIEIIAKQTEWFILTYKKSRIIKFSFTYTFMEKLKDWSIWRCLASWDTLLDAVIEMLEYLLDNNLLWQTKIN